MANPRTIARLEARILERAAYCLQFEVSDPRASFITVVRCKLSSDLSSGKIYYSVLGGESDKSKAQHMLDHAAGFIQRQVARVLEMRRMPRLSWAYDGSAENAADIARLIGEARRRDMEINPALAAEPPVAPADPRALEEQEAQRALFEPEEGVEPDELESDSEDSGDEESDEAEVDSEDPEREPER